MILGIGHLYDFLRMMCNMNQWLCLNLNMATPKIFNIEDFPAYLQTLTRKDWQPLLDLIPEIEATEKFDSYEGLKEIEPGVFEMPHSVPAPCVWKFQEFVIEKGLQINFDWGSWELGKELLFHSDPEDIMTQDLLTLCKLMTTMVRSNRFVEGALAGYFQRGHGIAILKRIDDIVNNKLVC